MDKYLNNTINGVDVQYINDSRHPVHGQRGLFATRKWHKFDVIGEYTGEVICDYIHSEYVISFMNISSSICLDAKNMGNECRFINHYKGINEKPNCKYSMTYINCKPIILVVVIENIEIGDEILIDYGYDI